MPLYKPPTIKTKKNITIYITTMVLKKENCFIELHFDNKRHI
jgi:hypothetical protein